MYSIAFLAIVASLVCFAVELSQQKTECEIKRDEAERLLKPDKYLGPRNELAILVPNCNADGTYATLQCHHNSNFCQCWDKEGIPLTQPKKNLKKCSCMVERAKVLRSIPPSQTDIPEMLSCDQDGSYTAKQCNRQVCWCVNPDTGRKVSSESRDKANFRCSLSK